MPSSPYAEESGLFALSEALNAAYSYSITCEAPGCIPNPAAKGFTKDSAGKPTIDGKSRRYWTCARTANSRDGTPRCPRQSCRGYVYTARRQLDPVDFTTTLTKVLSSFDPTSPSYHHLKALGSLGSSTSNALGKRKAEDLSEGRRTLPWMVKPSPTPPAKVSRTPLLPLPTLEVQTAVNNALSAIKDLSTILNCLGTNDLTPLLPTLKINPTPPPTIDQPQSVLATITTTPNLPTQSSPLPVRQLPKDQTLPDLVKSFLSNKDKANRRRIRKEVAGLNLTLQFQLAINSTNHA